MPMLMMVNGDDEDDNRDRERERERKMLEALNASNTIGGDSILYFSFE